jgi:hypothetical protein
MGQPLRLALSWIVAVVVALPLSAVTTILLFPLWSWIEDSTGIESVGHSGPDGWCYVVVFFIFVSGATLMVFRHRDRSTRARFPDISDRAR